MDHRANNYETYILYSETEKGVLNDLLGHLRLLNQDRQLGPIIKREISQFTYLKSLSKLINDRTVVVVCLISHQFTLTDIGTFFKKTPLFYEHFCGRIQVIPILVDNCDLSLTAFYKIARLGSNILPIRDLDERKYHRNLSLIAMDLYCSITRKAQAQMQVDEDWAKAQKEDSVDEYLKFYKGNRLSKYGERAITKYKKLLDEQLWNQATTEDKVEYYLKYLKQSPLLSHKNKAIVKIAGIEYEEEVYRKDLQDTLNSGILLDYKSRFRHNGHVDEVNQKLNKAFARPTDQWIDKAEEIQTTANYLNYKIYQTCTPEEIFTYDLLEKVKGNIDRKVIALIAYTRSLEKSLVFYTSLGYILSIIFLSFLLLSNIRPRSSNVQYYFIVVVLAISFLVIRALIRIRRDIKWYQQRCAELNKKFTHLKIAFLKYDTVVQGKITKLLDFAEDWVTENKRKKIGYYLFYKWIRKADRNPKWNYFETSSS